MTQSVNVFTSQPLKMLFTNAEYIKTYYSNYIDPNIDDNSINGFIMRAQTERTQQVLGFNLYLDFSTQLTNLFTTGATMSVAYTTLWNSNECSIVDELSMWAIYYAYPFFQNRATNKNVSSKNSQWARPITTGDLDYSRNEIRNSAEYCDQRILQYITNNVPNFPNYFQNTQINSVPAQNFAYSGGAGEVFLNNNFVGYGMVQCCGPYNRELNW